METRGGGVRTGSPTKGPGDGQGVGRTRTSHHHQQIKVNGKKNPQRTPPPLKQPQWGGLSLCPRGQRPLPPGHGHRNGEGPSQTSSGPPQGANATVLPGLHGSHRSREAPRPQSHIPQAGPGGVGEGAPPPPPAISLPRLPDSQPPLAQSES